MNIEDAKEKTDILNNILLNENSQGDSPCKLIYGDFWTRVGAVLIDGIILLPLSILINFMLQILTNQIIGIILLPLNILIGFMLKILTSLIIGILYYPVFVSSVLQGTPGKALLKLQVVNIHGKRLSFKEAILRYISSLALNALTLGWENLFAAFTEKKQTLHDIVASTLVVKRSPPAINYLEAWTHEITRIASLLNSSDGSQKKQDSRKQKATSSENYNSDAVTAHSELEKSRHQSTKPNLETLETLQELFSLYEKGALTQEEYEAQKKKLLEK